MHPVLRLYEDTFNDAVGDIQLPGLPRMIFVVHGSITVAGRTLTDGEAWHSQDAASFTVGKTGATCWRWELSSGDAAGCVIVGPGIRSHEKLAAALETIPKGDLLMRG